MTDQQIFNKLGEVSDAVYSLALVSEAMDCGDHDNDAGWYSKLSRGVFGLMAHTLTCAGGDLHDLINAFDRTRGVKFPAFMSEDELKEYRTGRRRLSWV